MIALCPSALVSLDDSVALFCESLGKLKAAESVDIAEVIEQLKATAESARNLRAFVSSELPEASWQNREELEELLERIQKLAEARALEQLRSRLLALATELERGSIVHRRALRVDQVNQLRDQAINELRSQAGLERMPPTLPGPEADRWIAWACGLKEPEDVESLQTLRNGFPHLDDFVSNLEPEMWIVKTVPEPSLQNGKELEGLIEEIREHLRSRLLALATELEHGSIVHRRAPRVNELNQFRDQAINELRSQAMLEGTPPTLPGPEAGQWIEWACGLKEPEDAESLQTLRNGFGHLDDFVANLEPDMWVAAGSPTLEILPQAERSADETYQEQSRLGKAAVSLRGKLGESVGSVQKYATPLEEATTPSLEALKAYSLGWKTSDVKGLTAALPFFKRAVELDPNFAMAYGTMSLAYRSLNQEGRAAENARKAYELREKVSERERLSIEAFYYLSATGELEKAAQAHELWRQAYPRDHWPYINLAFISASLGNWEKALGEAHETLRQEPNAWVNYGNLGNDYANLNRLDEAEAVYKQAEEQKFEDEGLLEYRYQLAFLKGDRAQMAQLAAVAMSTAGAEDLLLAAQADTEAWYGKLKNARKLIRRAMDLTQNSDAKETAATYQVAAALREVESGNRQQALADVDAAMRLAPNRNVRAVAALALARAGYTAPVEKVVAELDKTFPLDTLVQRYWLPTIRAAIALQREDPNRAIELLQVASAIELCQPTQATIYLCPAYLRGQAYLMLRDGNAAAPEFQKFIDHRGLVVNFPWGALARLGLARAYALQGDTAKAKAAYQDFLTLWKDADPDIPILQQAKAEYAKLQ